MPADNEAGRVNVTRLLNSTSHLCIERWPIRCAVRGLFFLPLYVNVKAARSIHHVDGGKGPNIAVPR